MAGILTPGTRLPSTHELVERYTSANATIQRALAVLKAEGFLYGRAGKGVYVRDRQPFVVEAAAYLAPSAQGHAYRLHEVAEVKPPADVAHALNLDAEGTAILRHRLLTHDGEPIELSWSYYPAEIAAGTPLNGRGRIPGGAPRALADLGHPQREFVDRLSVRPPTSEEVEGLDLPEEVAVIRQFRVVYSDEMRPVEVSILVKGGHHHEVMYRHAIGDPSEG